MVETVFVALTYVMHYFAGLSRPAITTSACAAVHLGSLTVATVLYRLSPLHPLAKFPGPTLYKISSLRYAQVVASGWRHKVIQSLHQQYGDIVRIGERLEKFCTGDLS